MVKTYLQKKALGKFFKLQFRKNKTYRKGAHQLLTWKKKTSLGLYWNI